MGAEEYLDVLTKTGEKTGISKPRSRVHADGDYHRGVCVLLYAENTGELLLQKRADSKDSWPGKWDISCGGHISAGDSSLATAQRELQEELGITLPEDAFELLFVFLQESVLKDGTFINNEFSDIYLVKTFDPIPLEAFTLQESEVSAVRYLSIDKYRRILTKRDPKYIPYDVNGPSGEFFNIIEQRYKKNSMVRSSVLPKKIQYYAPVTTLDAEV